MARPTEITVPYQFALPPDYLDVTCMEDAANNIRRGILGLLDEPDANELITGEKL